MLTVTVADAVLRTLLLKEIIVHIPLPNYVNFELVKSNIKN